MENLFTECPIEEVTKYLKEHFPYVTIGIVGEWEGLQYAIEKGGNPTQILSGIEHFPEVCCIVACGGSEEIDVAKSYHLPYLVLTKELPFSAFQKIGINDFQIMEYGYPNIVIIETNKNELQLQSDLTLLLLSILLECVGIVGSGLREERVREAKKLIQKVKENLLDFAPIKEVLPEISEGLERIGGARFSCAMEKIIALTFPLELAHARFYSIFCLLYALCLFTKIDFCVILPHMDLIRVRMLAEEVGLKVVPKTISSKDIEWKLGFVKDLLPKKGELEGYLKRFLMERGNVMVDYKLVLSSLLLTSTLIKEPNLLVEVLESGYVDALIDL